MEFMIYKGFISPWKRKIPVAIHSIFEYNKAEQHKTAMITNERWMTEMLSGAFLYIWNVELLKRQW